MRMALWHSHSNSRERMFSMTYSIEGLCPDRFASLFALDDAALAALNARRVTATADRGFPRSEEHTSELQSLMRISYAVFCLKKKQKSTTSQSTTLLDVLITFKHRTTNTEYW